MTLIDPISAQVWLSSIRQSSNLRLTRIPLQDCADWRFQDGRLIHRTGRFFSVTGLENAQTPTALQGPDLAMIDQPEIGWLGFLVRQGPDGIEWLLQAKTEPGNIRETHLAPSLQATRSNYQRAHGGRPTLFLDIFLQGSTFLSDAPHSEQGTRFLWKFNRNSVLAVPYADLPQMAGKDHWQWCGSNALRDLLSAPYAVNTDARSVIATAPWALLANHRPLFSAPVLAVSYQHRPAAVALANLLRGIVPLSASNTPRWSSVALGSQAGWHIHPDHIADPKGREAVAFYSVQVEGREVRRWCQPFLMPGDVGDYALYLRITDRGAEVFLRSYNEIGFGTRREYGPSLHSAFETPAAMQGWADPTRSRDLLSLQQSDEGGRFFQADARYRIVLTQTALPRPQYPFGQWVALSTLESLANRSGTTTNELRTLISLLLSHAFDKACAGL